MSTVCNTQTQSAFDFNGIKNIDTKTEYIVFGFIRLIETLFVIKVNIPSDIMSMCLMYYYNPEFFTKHGSDMVLSNDGRIVEHDTDVNDCVMPCEYHCNTAYGNLEINKTDYIKCIWKFKILKLPKTKILNITKNNQHDRIGIGINSSNKLLTERHFFYDDHSDWIYNFFDDESWGKPEDVKIVGESYVYKGCAVIQQCEIKFNANIPPDVAINYEYGCILNKGDVVTMELDVENETLKYYVNSKDQGVAFKNIHFDENKKYFMAVSCNITRIELITFDAIYK